MTGTIPKIREITALNQIDPHLFTRLMCLPPQRRIDLLEFIGATPVADLQLEQLIEMMATPSGLESRSSRTEPCVTIEKTSTAPVRPLN